MAKRPTTKPSKTKRAAKNPARAMAGISDAAAKRVLFVEAYLANGGNATQAAISAGFSEHSARKKGSDVLRESRVQAMLRERQDALVKKLEMNTERVLQEVARIAFFDPRRLFNPNGSPKAINDLDDDTAAALAGLDVLEEFDGAGKDRVFVGYTKKYKIAGKVEALDKLMKNLGLYEKDNHQKTDPLAELLARVSGNGLKPVEE